MTERVVAKHQDRLKAAIALMERVDAHEQAKFYIGTWRSYSEIKPKPIRSKAREIDLHTCGTAACFGGWLTASKEWQSQKGSDVDGYPYFNGEEGPAAVAEYLGIPESDAKKLTFIADTENERNSFYNVECARQVTPLMVAEKLKAYLE